MFKDLATGPVVPEPVPVRKRRPFGVALGGGAARGWAHIGVMRVLAREGLVPDVIAGTSIGAVVGGCFASGKLDELEDFARSLTRRRVMGLMDFHLNGSGLIAGQRLKRMLAHHLGDVRIEALAPRFVAIATELGSGHEIWLTRGSLTEALRASYALPGIFDAVRVGGRWLMDGALVNPIPVTAARALGAEIVLCVNLNGADTRGRGAVIPAHGADEDSVEDELQTARGLFSPVRGAAMRMRQFGRRADGAPGIGAVMVDAFNITQDRIARSRLAGDPPDVMVAPRLGRMGLFDFHRADEAIALGMEAAERALDELREMLELPVAERG
ncbi:patatin-like phospholipase family protein [Chelatococcus composti]|jgi:NTE family protein|uniref:NTE family protein n=1 Tax=Chelatococcus composti TaxID=1743235 RepID=A0A841K4Y7_9HYPH|nr:patatin-like phospholipase family protein [Chelatococcus composti]MBB6166552.1 NTE family protein [Chelatococcus composti]MBS7734518.1 patatin-like phospholipase family protein [Chelatococcus composti]GGG27481.1 phospholipase [Chelatococcus composti]